MKPFRVAILLSLLPVLASCNDSPTVSEDRAASKIAHTQCGLLFDCECDAALLWDEEVCVEQVELDWMVLQGQAMNFQLEYDGGCVGRTLEDLRDRGCAPPELPDDDDTCEAGCAAYHGSVPLGGECQVVSGTFFSTCAQGLACAGGTCAEPCAGSDDLALGELCRDGFEVVGDCGDGLVCDAGGSDTCIGLPGEGQACPQGDCAEGLWCQQIITETSCVRLGAVGDECNDSEGCLSEYCDNDDLCAELPVAGEECSGLCADALLCVEGTCLEGPGEGEFCYQNQCGEGLVCTSAVCEPAPAAVCFESG